MRISIITSALLTVLISLSGVPLHAAEVLFVDGAYDIGDLLQLAEKNHDLENEDAVILFERFEIHWTTDGRLAETTHRAVLVRTGYGIRRFADLRIPWDSARQKLTVHALRTFRLSDEQWITTGPTAVVETLPFAVDRAPDYCHLRETMLLHDGVELPCVLETSWTVEDTEPFRAGASGTRSLTLAEPALVSQFVLTMPAGMQPVIQAAGGATQPTMAAAADGFQTWNVEMKDLPARPHPETDDSILQEPRISWSTWKDWGSLAADLDTRVTNAALLNDELREAVEEKLKDARTPAEKTRMIAGFVGEATRLVSYGSGWWPEPRPAHRTWATGYGHRLDRVLLAAALYREAGFTVQLTFRGAGYGEADISVPGLGWSEGVSLLVSGDGVDGWFNPESAVFAAGDGFTAGHTTWNPSAGAGPEHRNIVQPDFLAFRFDLSFDGEKKAWTGSGVLQATGTISPFHRVSGLGSEAKDYLSGLVGTLLGPGTINGCNPERFDSGGVTLGFDLDLPAGERDDLGRLKIQTGSLPSGPQVDLYAEERESDVYLPAPLDVQIELHLEPGDLEMVHLPEDALLSNDAGLWQVETSREEDKVLLFRRLQLAGKHYPAAQWSELRALLLAGQHQASRVLYFK